MVLCKDADRFRLFRLAVNSPPQVRDQVPIRPKIYHPERIDQMRCSRWQPRRPKPGADIERYEYLFTIFAECPGRLWKALMLNRIRWRGSATGRAHQVEPDVSHYRIEPADEVFIGQNLGPCSINGPGIALCTRFGTKFSDQKPTRLAMALMIRISPDFSVTPNFSANPEITMERPRTIPMISLLGRKIVHSGRHDHHA